MRSRAIGRRGAMIGSAPKIWNEGAVRALDGANQLEGGKKAQALPEPAGYQEVAIGSEGGPSSGRVSTGSSPRAAVPITGGSACGGYPEVETFAYCGRLWPVVMPSGSHAAR